MAIWPNQTTKRLRKTTKNPLNTLWKTNENDLFFQPAVFHLL